LEHPHNLFIKQIHQVEDQLQQVFLQVEVVEELELIFLHLEQEDQEEVVMVVEEQEHQDQVQLELLQQLILEAEAEAEVQEISHHHLMEMQAEPAVRESLS
jgi:hypothetical protein